MKAACLLLFALMVALGAAFPAYSHSWYPKECCSGRDCVVADKMITDSLGNITVVVGPHRIMIPRGFVSRPSPDGRIHVCFMIDDEGTSPEPRCLFVPAQS
jgi:hypothetical protein